MSVWLPQTAHQETEETHPRAGHHWMLRWWRCGWPWCIPPGSGTPQHTGSHQSSSACSQECQLKSEIFLKNLQFEAAHGRGSGGNCATCTVSQGGRGIRWFGFNKISPIYCEFMYDTDIEIWLLKKNSHFTHVRGNMSHLAICKQNFVNCMLQNF